MNEIKKEGKEISDSVDQGFENLPKSTDNYSFSSQKTNKDWLVWATDRNGVVTALTYVPD